MPRRLELHELKKTVKRTKVKLINNLSVRNDFVDVYKIRLINYDFILCKKKKLFGKEIIKLEHLHGIFNKIRIKSNIYTLRYLDTRSNKKKIYFYLPNKLISFFF